MTQEQALDILKTGANVFLTGEPGAGKTHTIRTYIEYLREHGVEPAITASTGIAATHIHGMTIHAWSGVGIKKRLSAMDIESIAGKQHVYKRIEQTKVLIIDEISMLSADMLESVDAVCRAVKRNPNDAFGGMQVICVGDFFQLPPVTDERGTSTQFAFDSRTWPEARFIVCYLTEQHRQDDPVFLSILSAIRGNAITDEHVRHIRTRIGVHDEVVTGVTRLFSHNENVDTLNLSRLDGIGEAERTFDMDAIGPAKLTLPLVRGCLSPEKLRLKVGAVVMCTKNNLSEGFVNGTLGEVIGFAKESGYPIIRTRQGRTITISPMEWAFEEGGIVRAKIVQIPLRLAWAITIHKSQGMSMDAAVMDLSGVFEYGQGYVALSRVRRLSGLYLIGYNEKSMSVHPDILSKDGAFRISSDTALQMFSEMPASELKSLQANFMKAIGGKEQPIEKESTGRRQSSSVGRRTRSVIRDSDKGEKRWERTLELVSSGLSILEAAEQRGRTEGTILEHLESLKAIDKLPRESISHLSAGKEKELDEIRLAFTELGSTTLKPVFDRFNGVYPYELIKLARLLSDKM